MKLAAAEPRMHLSSSNFFDREEVKFSLIIMPLHASLTHSTKLWNVSLLQQLNASCNSSSVPVMGVSSDQLKHSGLQLASLQQDALASSLNVMDSRPCSYVLQYIHVLT